MWCFKFKVKSHTPRRILESKSSVEVWNPVLFFRLGMWISTAWNSQANISPYQVPNKRECDEYISGRREDQPDQRDSGKDV